MVQPQVEQVFKEYRDYDWDHFDEFQDGIKEILDNYLESLRDQDPSISAIPALDQQQLINQAKSFFYCTKTGNILNLDDYEKWERSQKIVEIKDDEQEDVQQPTQEKQPEQIIELNSSEANVEDKQDEPPYSSNYQELVELIVSGKPVPGIKQIPDTVLTGQSSTASATQRVKPWEKK
ncbi:hypothetical protein CLIB1444_09S01992 [[Candida] jaroonii]|uniref:Uncharacterized protein n=1 Tax=[Candida] jaroonii TaxID=467808 RepID=A0ACA9YBS9_9ASCO|nr:hypothetical protein CLIB1444_09S01992 [[Candida] jaroonii]